MVKNLPAMQEMWVRSLGQEEPLEKEMPMHSSMLAWEIPRTEKSGRIQSMGPQKSQTQLSNQTTVKTNTVVCSVHFSHSVVSDTSRPHESQHARPPCPSPTPGVHSDSCPSSQ